MPKGVRIVLYAVGGIVVAVLLLAGVVVGVSNSHMARSYTITPEKVSIPTDSASIAQGHHIVITRGCNDCHGADMAGGVIMDDPAMGFFAGPNLTGGEGSPTAGFTDEDWVRAIRHGVGPNGKALRLMPSDEYYYLSDGDLGSLIAYLESLEPIDNNPGAIRPGPLGRALFAFGKLPNFLPAEHIPHDAPRPEAPPEGLTLEFGSYIAKGCTGCHGDQLAGGPIPGGAPSWPAAANLTPDKETGLAGWTQDDFITALRTGIRPDGTEIDTVMPWKAFGMMKDVELDALWLYVQSLEPREFGQNQ